MSGTAVLLAFSAVSAGVSAIGQLSAGAAAQRAANTNARALFQTANAERLTAIENAKRQARINKKIQGTNRAHDPDKLDLLEDSAMEQKLAELDIIHAGEIKAINFENKGRSEIARGQEARRRAKLGAFTSVLMGVGSAAAAGIGGFSSPATIPVGNSAGNPLQFVA